MKTSPYLLLILCLCLISARPAMAEAELNQQIADRYELLLIKSPQPGAPFDRVVEWYSTGGGGLEVLQQRWKDAAAKDEGARSSYLLLQGLLAERRRDAEAARNAYRDALALGANPAQAGRLLGALETTEGRFDAAAAAYEKALTVEELPSVDRLDLMRSLALLYQRSFNEDKALAVWRDALIRFPGDQYVLEESGEAFLVAGNYAEARKAFTAMRDAGANDPYRRVAASLRLARTAEAEGKIDEAVSIYDHALEETSEGSWIQRDVRNRIEELFRRKNDLPGLLAYYEKRTNAVPGDYVSLVARAEVLDELGRSSDGVDLMRKAAQLAPDNKDLQLSLVRWLRQIGNTDEAIAEAEKLALAKDAQDDVLILLGDLRWSVYEGTKQDKSRDEALAAWGRIAPSDSQDVARIARLADIFQSHGLTDEAMNQWKRIVTLSPGSSDARQRLAEIYLKRNDKPAAETIVAGLVEGERTRPENYLSLARIQEKFEWFDLARATVRQGLERNPSDYDLLNLSWTLALNAKDRDAVDSLFPQVWAQAPNEFFAEDAAKKYASFLSENDSSQPEGRKMADRLTRDPENPQDAVILLRLALSAQDEKAATKAVEYLKTQGNALRTARAQADFAQAFGSVDDQIASWQAVAVADPRMAVDSLRTAARIQADNGKTDAALATMKQLIEKSPADASLYAYYADIAARSGRMESAVEELRKAVRYVEDATSLRLKLAELLQMQQRNDEAAAVLEEAFVREDRDARRMEIFRRQIEVASQAGRIDELIAKLKERQAKEQGGAKYGAYLAEIYMAQGDTLSARDELERSLGRNPDNASAVSRLRDLSEQGGDQDDVLRLSARLYELEPSTSNRADYIERLFSAGETEKGLEEFGKAREAALKKPGDWSSVLIAMRRAGLDAEADAFIAEVASRPDASIEQRWDMANLRLQQRQFIQAKEAMWQLLSMGSLADALQAVSQDTSANRMYGSSGPWLRYAPFYAIMNGAQGSLQQMFTNYRGRGIYRSYPMMYYPAIGGGNASPVTPEQKAQVMALFTLQRLAFAEGQSKEFQSRLHELLKKNNVPRSLQATIYQVTNDTDGLRAIVAAEADDPSSDLTTARLLIEGSLAEHPDDKERKARITERLEKADPVFACSKMLADTRKEFLETGNTVPAEKREALKKRIQEIRQRPEVSTSPQLQIQLVSLALAGKFFDTAIEILDGMDDKSGNLPADLLTQILMLRNSVLMQAIMADSPLAPDLFVRLIKDASSAQIKTSPFMFRSGMLLRGVRQPYLLIQNSNDLAVGDSELPVATYRTMTQSAGQETAVDRDGKISAWLAKRASTDTLDVYGVAMFYQTWFAGNRDEAIKRLEAVQKKNPTPRGAALLLEAYERSNANDKALAVIDVAEMQDGETAEIRTFRKLRLLRTAGKLDEARALLDKLAKGRVSYTLRDQIANEVNLMGIPVANYQNLAQQPFRTSRSSRGSDPMQETVSRLVNGGRKDEAEKLARQVLQRPFPSANDYQAINQRDFMLRTLYSMKRLDALESELRDQLAENPKDFNTIVRLAEILTLNDSSNIAADLLIKAVDDGVPTGSQLSYAVSRMQRGNGGQEKIAELLCRIIKRNPDELYTGGIQLQEVLQRGDDQKSQELLADTIASLDQKRYDQLFLPQRLSGQYSEVAILPRLAEFSYQAGKTDQAIALLSRAKDESLTNLYQSWPLLIRLMEFQLLQGKKDDARAIMLSLVGDSSQSPAIRSQGGIAGILMNMMQNSYGGGKSTEDQLIRFGKIAEQTDTFQVLMDSLSPKEGQPVMPGISAGLVLRTIYKQPGVVKEWKEIANNKTTTLGYVSPSVLATGLNVLAEQSDGEKTVPALLAKMPDAQYYSGDGQLAFLVQIRPILEKYRDNPKVAKFLESIVGKSLSDPNAVNYLAYSENYPEAVSILIDLGQVDLAQKLFDATATVRSNRNSGRDIVFQTLEAKLNASRGSSSAYQFLCAGTPGADGKLKVFWKASLAVDDSSMSEYYNRKIVQWDSGSFAFGTKQKPLELEILAGPNPLAMERVALVKGPAASGSIDVKAPGSLGLLQARWKRSDGTEGWGPLTAYLQGENLASGNAIPTSIGGAGKDAFSAEQPGPLGPKSAVTLETLSPQTELKVDLASVKITESEEGLAFLGWFGSRSRNGAPSITFRIKTTGGNDSTDGDYISQLSDGMWTQSVKIYSKSDSDRGWSSLPAKAEQFTVTGQFRATNGYNSQWAISGAWSGVQVIRFPWKEQAAEVKALLEEAGKARGKKDFAGATDAYFKALKLSPGQVLRQNSSSVFECAEKAQKLPEMYSLFLAPALYLPNPLTDNRMDLQGDGFLARLVEVASRPDASPSAKEWLQRIQDIPLSESTRFAIDVALLKAAKDNPEKTTPEKLAAFLGWQPEKANIGRLRMLWYSRGSDVYPVKTVLEVIEATNNTAKVRELMKKMPVTADVVASQLMLEAWLAAPTDPQAALTAFNQALAQQKSGQNSVSFGGNMQDWVLRRIALTHPEPGNILAAFTALQGQRSSDPRYAQKTTVEFLYTMSKQETPLGAKFASLWADAEFAGYKIPGYEASRERLGALIRRLQEAQDWERIETLKGLVESSKTIDQGIRQELARLSAVAALRRGDSDIAWPVVWSKPGASPTEATVCWQWNLRDTRPDEGFFDMVTAVSDKPALTEINGQDRVEIYFGEMPNDLKLIGKVDGSAAAGELALDLPAANGFLRAVAVLGDRQVRGPMAVVVSGPPIYPPVDQGLKELLMSGAKPLDASQLFVKGAAPDGSPAVQLGVLGEGDNLSYEGPSFPLPPARFCVSRCWLRRAGNGVATVTTRFQGDAGAGKQEVDLLLAYRSESAGSWVYYTRAVPSLPSHTFWVPYDHLTGVIPCIQSAQPGTQLATWEMIDATDSAYGRWLVELVLLKGQLEKASTPQLVDRLAQLVAVEPLTVLDYHGDWVCRELIKGGKSSALPPLFRTALEAEANPLFARTRPERVYANLFSVIDNPDVPLEVRQQALEIGLASCSKNRLARKISLERRELDLAKVAGKDAEVRTRLKGELLDLVKSGDDQRKTLLGALKEKAVWRDRLVNDLFTIVIALDDETITRGLLSAVSNAKDDSLEAYRRTFAALALEMSLPDPKLDEQWQARVDKGFALTERVQNARDILLWPSVMADTLAAKALFPEMQGTLRQKAFDQLIKLDINKSENAVELTRSAAQLIQADLEKKDTSSAREVSDRLGKRLGEREAKLSDENLRLLLPVLDGLMAEKIIDPGSPLLQRAAKDAADSQTMADAYEKYRP
ncbi:tetratricopeptide (TPR) repeat-containing protein [Terrimicrobium sacchariphilum]|uniref:Tetratricopeptide (TPR) repeat-containing protein n=1 Tax=Terrimicrobium sacchariphilum TaxID=690879 RepID=A0A146G7G7_TERSA|nr:tetratricopeptide repeat protein [Terrimicrobium sacchariphilum]GAT33451.1 tetratricopeptide (TPR) repeat-containing protein [Terrimicrobium sacchariphilum]